MTEQQRWVVSDTKILKAMTHPIRRRIMDVLHEQRSATSTTVARALGENTGTTSYHLRILADAGIIEEDPDRPSGRERWWRNARVSGQAPRYEDLDDEGKAALDEWKRQKVDVEQRLIQRYIDTERELGEWAHSSRMNTYMTQADLANFQAEFHALTEKYGRTPEAAPEDAKLMAVRMFYLPWEQ